MRTPEGDKIHAIIRTRTGPEEAISAPEIAAELGWLESAERRVRQIISDESLLWPGIVCAAPGQGFYMPAEVEHLESRRAVLVKIKTRAEDRLRRFDQHCREQGIYLCSSTN